MSKTSAKQRYEQLMEWIPTLENKRRNTRKPNRRQSSQQASFRQSRMAYYESKRG